MELNCSFRVSMLALFPLALMCGSCYANTVSTGGDSDSFNDWLSQGNIYGEVKTMHFLKNLTVPSRINKRTPLAVIFNTSARNFMVLVLVSQIMLRGI